MMLGIGLSGRLLQGSLRLKLRHLVPVSVLVLGALLILRGLHARWSRLLDSLQDSDFQRAGKHPDIDGRYTIDDVLDIYSQHGTGHIEQLGRQLAAGKQR